MRKMLLAALLGVCAVASNAQESYQITSGGFFGCTTREHREKLQDLSDYDMTAFMRGMLHGFVKDECVVFQGGERVVMVDSDTSVGLVKVRRTEESTEYWIDAEAVAARSGDVQDAGASE